ncbi:MAG TPA: VOC family protein [Chthoniobacterales bacterium]|jgi:predicted enzyme related to lactoylglutathione lyase
MKIVEIAFTGYPVTDMQRARAFYEGVLKLELTRMFENGDRRWIEYDLGQSTFAISNMSSDDWKPSNDGPAIAFEVEDFDSSVATMRANNVKFTLDPFETPVCRMAIITDPDGNSICIHKRHAL